MERQGCKQFRWFWKIDNLWFSFQTEEIHNFDKIHFQLFWIDTIFSKEHTNNKKKYDEENWLFFTSHFSEIKRLIILIRTWNCARTCIILYVSFWYEKITNTMIENTCRQINLKYTIWMKYSMHFVYSSLSCTISSFHEILNAIEYCVNIINIYLYTDNITMALYILIIYNSYYM